MHRLITTFVAMIVLSALLIAGLGFYVQRTVGYLSGRTAQVLRENYDSVTFMDRALGALGEEDRFLLSQFARWPEPGMADNRTFLPLKAKLDAIQLRLDEAVTSEAGNVTLPGEREASLDLHRAADLHRSRLNAFLTRLAAHPEERTREELLSDYEADVQPAWEQVRVAAERIRKMNHDWMERTAARQAATTPRFILGGTLAAVMLLLASGAQLARRLGRQAREFQALRTHFVAIASHELRTPVTSLRMGLDLLAKESVGPLNADQKAVAEAGVEDCDRLLALSRQLLDVTKIQSGQLEMRRVDVELRPLVAESVASLRRVIQEKHATVDLDVGLPETARVQADPIKLIWVITNLLANALRYTPHGGEVRITARREKREIRISVSDKGPGIAPEIARTVFQPYFQAQAQPQGTAPPRGTIGLGLSIAQEIVAAHGGRIWVEPRPLLGGGTTITFTLPASHEEK